MVIWLLNRGMPSSFSCQCSLPSLLKESAWWINHNLPVKSKVVGSSVNSCSHRNFKCFAETQQMSPSTIHQDLPWRCQNAEPQIRDSAQPVASHLPNCVCLSCHCMDPQESITPLSFSWYFNLKAAKTSPSVRYIMGFFWEESLGCKPWGEIQCSPPSAHLSLSLALESWEWNRKIVSLMIGIYKVY